MAGPSARLLPDGERLHLQHGPIDLIVGVDAETADGRDLAFRAAWQRFQTVLQELVAELPLLRQAVSDPAQGAVASRMVQAARPHLPVFVTPMAAVAGAVADEVLSVMTQAAPLRRAYVNNGGDIAFHLTEGTVFRIAIAGLDGQAHGHVELRHGHAAGGLATSGQGGRSLSLGIADAVTVLATSAAEADVAATLIANAVDLPGHCSIIRAPANSLQPDSDLGSRLVVTGRGPLAAEETRQALARGEAVAKSMQARGLVIAAALFLNGQSRSIGPSLGLFIPNRSSLSQERTPAHA